jgi:hypothetical protein
MCPCYRLLSVQTKDEKNAETFEARDNSWCVNHGWIQGSKIGEIIPCSNCDDMNCGDCRCGGCGNCMTSDCCECKNAEYVGQLTSSQQREIESRLRDALSYLPPEDFEDALENGMDSKIKDLADTIDIEEFFSESWLTEGKCAMCNSPSKFSVSTAIGERSFCCEACYAEYVGLPVMEEGYYGLGAESEDYLEGVEKGIPMGYCEGCSHAYPLDAMNEYGMCEECEGVLIADIDWETDGEDVDLPSSVRVPSDLEEDEIADYLSDNYGFLVNGFVVMDAETFEAEYIMEDGWLAVGKDSGMNGEWYCNNCGETFGMDMKGKMLAYECFKNDCKGEGNLTPQDMRYLQLHNFANDFLISYPVFEGEKQPEVERTSRPTRRRGEPYFSIATGYHRKLDTDGPIGNDYDGFHYELNKESLNRLNQFVDNYNRTNNTRIKFDVNYSEKGHRMGVNVNFTIPSESFEASVVANKVPKTPVQKAMLNRAMMEKAEIEHTILDLETKARLGLLDEKALMESLAKKFGAEGAEEIATYYQNFKEKHPELHETFVLRVADEDWWYGKSRKNMEEKLDKLGFDFDIVNDYWETIGYDLNPIYETCTDCEGEGIIITRYYPATRDDPADADYETCEMCEGEGKVLDNPLFDSENEEGSKAFIVAGIAVLSALSFGIYRRFRK